MNKINGDLESMINEEKTPKILTLDIETSPVIAYTWASNMYETGLIELIEPGQIMCYSAKWLDGKQVTKGLKDYKGYKKGVIDDKNIVQDLHKLLDTCDILITQNGVQFDTKYINSRFLTHNLPPPSPYKNIDTKLEAKKTLKLPSYALDNMGKYFGLGHKLEHEGFDLWKKCIAGDVKAWRKMKEYNAQDVILTEKIYLKLRPFMKTHPNVTSYNVDEGCPKCGSVDYQNRGFQYNTNSKFQRCQCSSCHGWFRQNKNLLTRSEKKNSTNL